MLFQKRTPVEIIPIPGTVETNSADKYFYFHWSPVEIWILKHLVSLSSKLSVMTLIAWFLGAPPSNNTQNKHIIKFKQNYPELFNINFSDLTNLWCVGSGSFGTVFKAKLGGKWVAAKRIDMKDKVAYKYLVREILNLKKLKHDNVLQYIGIAHDDLREVYLITDYVKGTTLYKLTKKMKRNYPVIVRILIHVAYGMRYMNSINMLHRDIKLDNILVWKLFKVGWIQVEFLIFLYVRSAMIIEQ